MNIISFVNRKGDKKAFYPLTSHVGPKKIEVRRLKGTKSTMFPIKTKKTRMPDTFSFELKGGIADMDNYY